MKRLLALLFIFLIILSLCSCSGLEVTPEIEEYIILYKTAVENTVTNKSASVKVKSVTKDNAIEFTTNTSVIEFVFKIENDKVLFDRNDYLNDELSATYTCDGNTVLVKNSGDTKFSDVTEQNEVFLYADKNPFVTLSLFRVDNEGKINNSVLKDVKKYTEGEYTVVEFALSDKAVSTILGYTKADGVVRESAGNTRKYYIDSNSKICKIQIDSNQKIISNGVEGEYITSMTVEIS